MTTTALSYRNLGCFETDGSHAEAPCAIDEKALAASHIQQRRLRGVSHSFRQQVAIITPRSIGVVALMFDPPVIRVWHRMTHRPDSLQRLLRRSDGGPR
jgi:hypothetical protein